MRQSARYSLLWLSLLALFAVTAVAEDDNPAIYITTSYVPSGLPNVPYSATLSTEGGTPPYRWSLIAGELPRGLSFNASSGTISGTPTAIGTSKFTVQVIDSKSISASEPISITINRTLMIATTLLPSATANAPYSAKIEVKGGEPPYTWGLPPVGLPRGLSFDPKTAVISGTPGPGCLYWQYWEVSEVGTFTCDFPVQVTDANSDLANTVLNIAITVPKTPLKITTASLPAGLTHNAYYEQLSAAGGTPPYGWSIVSGSPPPDLALDPESGLIGGSPTVPGTSYFTVQVTDADSSTATRRFSITIGEIRPGAPRVDVH